MKPTLALLTDTIVASAAVAASRFVSQAGGYPTTTAPAYGATRTAGAVGDLLPVDVLGTTAVAAAAAIAVGDAIKSDDEGRAAVAGASDLAVARALSAATAAGQLVEVLLTPAPGKRA
jgi:hypothetical protein